MQIVEIRVEYPSGITIVDRATFIQQVDNVVPSERLASILREFATSEAPPAVTAEIDGATLRLDARVDGTFSVSRESVMPDEPHARTRLFKVGHSWNKDQRQQFGRFAHTLSAASIAGAVGYWHSLQVWTVSAASSIAILLVLFVILFLAGMDSMNGE